MATSLGKVVAFRPAAGDKRGFGFIHPDGAARSREANVYFNESALDGSAVYVGDRVEFTVSARAIDNAKNSAGDRPHATRVVVIDDPHDNRVTETGGYNADR